MATNMEKELQAYKKFLNELYDNNSMEFFTNGGKDYASVLLSVLYSKANDSVKMFCEGLNPELFENEELRVAFMEYVSSGKRIQILMESNAYLTNHPAVDIMGKENVEIKVIKDEDRNKIFSTLHTDRCNFSIFDGKMIRLETDPIDYKAVGSFNRPEWASVLSMLFDDAFNKATAA